MKEQTFWQEVNSFGGDNFLELCPVSSIAPSSMMREVTQFSL
jgi:hypothetical protein